MTNHLSRLVHRLLGKSIKLLHLPILKIQSMTSLKKYLNNQYPLLTLIVIVASQYFTNLMKIFPRMRMMQNKKSLQRCLLLMI